MAVALNTTVAVAQDMDKQEVSIEGLKDLSIEDLANLQVTSVSGRSQNLNTAPAAVFVITSDDIRRSGATSLPEVLRLAPNLEVARINAYAWAVTARGFNMPEVGNKLLVLINGRSVYEPISSGVLWEQVAVDLENIDHIEVISGPGGTVWGANAVNGVINVITKSSDASQGLSLQVTDGGYERNASIRYGGRINDTAGYALYLRSNAFDETTPATAADVTSDAFRSVAGGMKINGRIGDSDSWSLRANYYDNNIAGGYQLGGKWLAASWSRIRGDGSSLNVNAFASNDERHHPVLDESRDTYTLNFTNDGAAWGRHHLTWGGEVRHSRQMFSSLVIFRFVDPTTRITVGSLFAQDEIALKPDIKLTLGLKGEYSSYSGLDWLPNVRLAWELKSGSMLWGAVSRAVRTPARVERELTAAGILNPSPDFGSEKLNAIEAGWRSQPIKGASYSLSAFYNIYDDLRVQDYPPAILPLTLKNGARGRTWGIEAWGKYDVRPGWRLTAGFNVLNKHFALKPGYNDLADLYVQGKDPGYQIQLRSQWDVSDAVKLDLAMRNVGKVDRAPVPSYTEADLRIGWRITDKLEASVTGLNLLHARHLQVWNPSNTPPRYISRSVFATLRYGY